MASVQDTERECAAMRERAIKDADKLRADAHAEAEKVKAQAGKDAERVRSGAVDEQIRKLMAQSPRRVELLQDIKNLEKRKGELKGELEAHEKQCLADRKAIQRELEAAKVAGAAAMARLLTEGEKRAARIVGDADAYVLHKAEEKTRFEHLAAEAERGAAEARERLALVQGQIKDAEASLAKLEARRYVLRNEEANQRNRLAKILGDLDA